MKKMLKAICAKNNINNIGPVLLLLIIISVFFFQLFYPKPSIFVTPEWGSNDILNFNLPVKYFLSSALKNAEFPLWSANIGTGFPILAESQMGAFYLPNLILFSLFS